MKPGEKNRLEDMAMRVRRHVIRMATKGGCFLGASLSCVDLIVYLYENFLELDPNTLNDPNRNYMFLSKGHDVPALYATFVEKKWLDASRLQNHLSVSDDIYWHPNRKIPGVEFHSGSLGHLLSVAMGVAYDIKLRGGKNKVVVILGDGELNEGTIWEGLLVAAAYKMDNLILVVDRNQFQANVATENLIPLHPLEDKFQAFGCAVASVDGHDFEALHHAFETDVFSPEKPSVLIANTVRGKGLPSIEARADRWFCNFSEAEIAALLQEFDTHEKARIESEVIIAR